MTGKYYVGAILLTAAALAATVVRYPYLPASAPTHWDIHGRPNGYSPRDALFFIPASWRIDRGDVEAGVGLTETLRS